MLPSAVIFDLDGTLFTLNTDWKLLKKKLSHFSEKYNFHSAFTPINLEVEKFTVFLLGTFDRKNVKSIKSDLYKIIEREELKGVTSGKEIDGATILFKTLQSKNIKIGIVSSNSKKTINKVVKKMNWDVNVIIGREDTSTPKPDSEGVNKCLKIMNLTPKKCWAVGNKKEDIDAYKRSKIRKIFFLGKDIKKLSQIYE